MQPLTSTPNTTMEPKAETSCRVMKLRNPSPRMQACSLKFCTAIERPAPMRLWPPQVLPAARLAWCNQIAPRPQQDEERNGKTQPLDDQQRQNDQTHEDAQWHDLLAPVELHAQGRPYGANSRANNTTPTRLEAFVSP